MKEYQLPQNNKEKQKSPHEKENPSSTNCAKATRISLPCGLFTSMFLKLLLYILKPREVLQAGERCVGTPELLCIPLTRQLSPCQCFLFGAVHWRCPNRLTVLYTIEDTRVKRLFYDFFYNESKQLVRLRQWFKVSQVAQGSQVAQVLRMCRWILAESSWRHFDRSYLCWMR